MKPRDERSALTSPQETWVSTGLNDPDAALWASITPPANATLQTRVRRRVAAFSLGMLAQRLHLRFPGRFTSRFSAQRGLLAAAAAFGATLGAAGYLTATSLSDPPGPAEAPLRFTSTTAALHPPSTSPLPGPVPTAAARSGATTVAAADLPEVPAARHLADAEPSAPRAAAPPARAKPRSIERRAKRAKATKKRWKRSPTKARRAIRAAKESRSKSRSASKRRNSKARQLAAALERY